MVQLQMNLGIDIVKQLEIIHSISDLERKSKDILESYDYTIVNHHRLQQLVDSRK